MTENYQRLCQQLLEHPERFESQGEGNALLKEHFDGVPVDRLRPLLHHSNSSVRGTAMFVANELGHMATDLIDDVIPLITDPDALIQWDALESVLVCSVNRYFDRFINVVRELENPHPAICELAMRLVSNANDSQIKASIKLVDKLASNQATHKQGLNALLKWQNDYKCNRQLRQSQGGRVKTSRPSERSRESRAAPARRGRQNLSHHYWRPHGDRLNRA